LGFAEVYLNGQNVEKEIRTLEVSQFVSQVSTLTEVRQQLVKQQQAFGKHKGVVMDGRDIGTVVFTNAELKLFMTASAAIRAKRRYKELLDKGENISFEDVLENVKSRDYIDSTRKDSPLIKADDAIEIDNSEMTLEQQFNKVLSLAKDKIELVNKNL
jgi:cytidylate kinase